MRSATSKTSGMLWLISTTARPVLAHALDLVEHVARLDDAERGGRLVHEDDLARPGDRAADRDALALAAGHVGDGRAVSWIRTPRSRERLVAAAPHLRLVEEAEPAQRAGAQQLAAEEHVRRRVDLGRQREVLVDGLDPELARLLRRVRSSTGRPSKRISPPSGGWTPGERLDERRLAGAVVADERDDLARVDGEVRAAQRLHVAEALDDPARLEQRLVVAHQVPLPAAGSGGRQRMPSTPSVSCVPGGVRDSTVLPRVSRRTLADRALAAGHEHDREALARGCRRRRSARRGSRGRPPSGSRPAVALGQRGGVDRLAVERLRAPSPSRARGARCRRRRRTSSTRRAPRGRSAPAARAAGCRRRSRAACRRGRGSPSPAPARGPRGGRRASRRRPARRPSGGRSRRRAAP